MLVLEATVAAIGYVALACLFGDLVAAGFLLSDGGPQQLRRSMIAWALVGLMVFIGVSALALLVQGAKLQRGMPSVELLWRYLTMTQSGHVSLARLAYAVVLLLMTWWLRRSEGSAREARWLAALALPLVASRSLMSHAVAVRDNTVIIVAADAVHSIAVAAWSGGLLALWRVVFVGARPWHQPLSWLTESVERFSRLALVSVALLLVTGVYQSWVHVGALDLFLKTDYGNVLLLKLFLLVVMLGYGALNFFSTRRLLAHSAQGNDGTPSVRLKSLRRIGAESVIGLLIFCATGLLTVLPPSVHAVHQATAGPPPFPVDSKSAKVYDPSEGASVKILSPKNEQVISGDRVLLQFNLTKGKRGHHVHAYIDGELMGMFESRNGTLNGIRPGRHSLELRVVAEDHKTELDASDRVEFMVK